VREAASALGRDDAETPMTMLTAWSLVHGLAKLVLDADVAPATYETATAEQLATKMLGRMCGEDSLTF